MANPSTLEVIYEKVQDFKDLEPVPGDFLLKKTSMELFTELARLPKIGLALEVGCGSGFNSALLSDICGRLVATDLPNYDAKTHSLGISIAQRLIAKLGLDNVSVLSCSGDRLPFPDDTFDLVYSSSVLEHIVDKETALREMLRVVKPRSSVVFIVPTYIQSLCAFAHLYLYAAKRIFEVIGIKALRMRPRNESVLLPMKDDTVRSSSSIAGSFMKNHPAFPLPEPHGSYKDIFQEFRCQLPWSWIGFAKRCGAYSVDTCALLFLPFNILEVFSTRFIAWAYYQTRYIHRVLARTPMQYLCYAWCVIAKKRN